MIRIIEAIQGYLRHLNDSLVECAVSASETAKTLTIVSGAMSETTKKLVQLFEQQHEQNARINKYIWDQAQKERLDAKLKTRVDSLESEVREIRKVNHG
jgi:hypothetical protein